MRVHPPSPSRPPRRATGAAPAAWVALGLVVLAPAGWAASADQAGTRDVVDAVRTWRRHHEAAVLGELADLLALPNLATDEVGIRRNADRLVERLASRGMDARLLEVEAGPPAVLGSLDVPGAARTVVFYAHYDGQPVDAAQWSSPPWSPVLRAGRLEDAARAVPREEWNSPLDPGWRLYARSASDDKSPIVALLAALDALRASGRGPSVNLRLFLEGEEEEGSSHLGELLHRHRDALRADLWVFCDGPVHQSGRAQVVFGARGVVGLGITTYGPNRPLHSGHYGNWAPNPAAELAGLLAGMRDDEGHVLIEGFGDDVRPPDAAIRRALDSIPPVEDGLREELALGRSEGGATLAEQLLAPALNIRGLASGAVGTGAANAIPTRASASIDFRLVPDQTPAGVRRRVEAHFTRLGYHVVHDEPDAATRRAHPRLVRLAWTDGYPPARTDLGAAAARRVVEIVGEAAGGEVVEIPHFGGSLPLYLFRDTLGADFVIVPMVNYDNNQHAADENVKLANLWEGIERYAALMAGLGRDPAPLFPVAREHRPEPVGVGRTQ